MISLKQYETSLSRVNEWNFSKSCIAMEIALVIILLTIFLGLWKIFDRVYHYYLFREAVNKIPGPSIGAPLIGAVWAIINVKREDRISWFGDVAEPFKNGIYRLWIGTDAFVNINKPERVEVILRNTKLIEKSMMYTYIEPWLGKGLLNSDGEKWFHDRKLITPAFHFGILEEFAEVMVEKAGILNKRLHEKIKVNGDKPFDVFDMIGKCALDIICETSMGVNVHAQGEVESEYIKAVQSISTEAMNRGVRPWLKFDWIFYRTAKGKIYQAAVETAHEKCTRVIERKTAEKLKEAEFIDKNIDVDYDIDGKKKRRAFLDLLLEASEKNERPLTTEEIREQVNTFMFAGHDTTGALISWSLFCIGNDEKLQNNIHQELDEVFGNSNEPATTKQVSQLKYLDRVIKETLRLYPSAPIISRKITENLQMGEYTVPKGVTLSIQIYQLHRHPELWPDPTKFDPDRFLPENSRDRHPYAYVPFSAGLRNCIGQKYALLEAKIVLTEVLRKWRVKSRDNRNNIKMYNAIILRPLDGIFMNMYPRNLEK